MLEYECSIKTHVDVASHTRLTTIGGHYQRGSRGVGFLPKARAGANEIIDDKSCAFVSFARRSQSALKREVSSLSSRIEHI